MNTELHAIAARANGFLRDRPGFRGCMVESETPPVVAYLFDTAFDAEQFKLTQSTHASQFKYEIPINRGSTVLEYR